VQSSFQNLYALGYHYFVRLLIFRQGIVYERTIFISFSSWYWIDKATTFPDSRAIVVVFVTSCRATDRIWLTLLMSQRTLFTSCSSYHLPMWPPMKWIFSGALEQSFVTPPKGSCKS